MEIIPSASWKYELKAHRVFAYLDLCWTDNKDEERSSVVTK